MTGFCSHCLRPVEVAFPVEPLFSLETAALLVPCSEPGIRQLISRHKHKLQPAAYRRHPHLPRQRVRLLFASDIVVLRNLIVSNDRYKKARRPNVPSEKTLMTQQEEEHVAQQPAPPGGPTPSREGIETTAPQGA